MAFDDAPDEVDSSARYADKAPEAAEAAPAGTEIPIDAFGDTPPTVGATFRVTAVDAENGTVTVSLSSPAKKMGGIAGKAAALDEHDQVPSGLTA